MAKAKEPKTASTRTAKAATHRTASASRRPTSVAPDNGGRSRSQMSAEEVYRLIQETAYYKAKARGFAPGHEVQDWIEAEAEVRMRLDERA
jgi:hypothetical protein